MHDASAATPPVPIGEHITAMHTVTPDDVAAFPRAMGDLDPLHLDADCATASRVEGRIASGTRTGAPSMGLLAPHVASRNLVAMGFELRYQRPVPAFVTVASEGTVTGSTPHRNGGRVVDLAGGVLDHRGRALVKGTGRVLVGLGTAS